MKPIIVTQRYMSHKKVIVTFMNHFFKQFTIIDFLSFFIPGAGTVLIFHLWVLPISCPIDAFFGANGIAKGFYFILLSYFAGQILSELTKPLESFKRFQIFTLVDTKTREKYWSEMMVKAAILGITAPASGSQEEQKEKQWRYIYHFVLLNCDCSKLRLLKGFSGMCRSGIATSVACIIMAWIHYWNNPCRILEATVFCILLIAVLYRRTYRFSGLWQDICCINFLLYEKRPSTTASS